MDNPALVKGNASVANDRSDSTPATKAAPREIGDAGQKIDSDLYMTYSLDHDVPFIADYYGIGPMLQYKDLDYKAEVDAIDNYLVEEVKSKRLENNTEAVKKRLKQLEKVAGIRDLEPTSQRVKKLAAYADYLKKLSDIDKPVTF